MSGSGGLPSLLSDFGQKIDLCSRIREILVNYPPGTTILKEFVQNADDAGASKIVFCLDKRTFGTEKLAHERMSSFQGHSLLVHNDAVFSDVDFESIQNIGEVTSQVKRECAFRAIHEATAEPNIQICWASGSSRFLTHCICVYVVCAMVCLCVFACDFVLLACVRAYVLHRRIPKAGGARQDWSLWHRIQQLLPHLRDANLSQQGQAGHV